MADQFKWNAFTGVPDNTGGGGLSIGSPVIGGSPYSVLFEDVSGNLSADTNFIYSASTLSVPNIYIYSGGVIQIGSMTIGYANTFTTDGGEGFNFVDDGTGLFQCNDPAQFPYLTLTQASLSTITSGLTVNSGGGGTANDSFTAQTDTNTTAFVVDAPTNKIKMNAPLAAGTTSQSPLTFTAGTNLSSPVNGAVEFDGTDWYVTI